MGVSPFNGNLEHFTAEYIRGAYTACNHSCTGAVDTSVRPLGAAKAEFHNPVPLGGMNNPGGLGSNQALMIDNI